MKWAFFPLVALSFILVGCEAPSNGGFDPFSEEGIERLKAFEGVKPGEVSLADCTSNVCREVREVESEAFMDSCTADAPANMLSDVRKFCSCARDDMFANNWLQTLIAAYSTRNSFDIAMPNIEQCTAKAFFQ